MNHPNQQRNSITGSPIETNPGTRNSNNNTSAVAIGSNQSDSKPRNLSDDSASVFAINENSQANILHAKQHLVLQQGPNLTMNGQTSAATHSNNNSTNGDDNVPWLQHMILNQINPLPSNLFNFNTNTTLNANNNDNGSNESRINQANAQNNHHQQQQPNQQNLLTRNSHAAASNLLEHQQQQQQQQQSYLCGVTMPAASECKQQFEHLLTSSQLEQQQFTNIQAQQTQQQQQQQQQTQQGAIYLNELQQQLLVANNLASSQIQVQLPAQQPTTATIGKQQVTPTTLQTTSSLPSGAGLVAMPTLQQQQQQLLLLALMLQQQSNNNNGGATSVDLNALSATLATPEGIQLLNSFGTGQLVQPQQHQSQQLISLQQHSHHQPQQPNVSAALPSYQFPIENVAPVTTTATAGPQKSAASNNQHAVLFARPQSQQQSQLVQSLQPPTPFPLLMSMVQPQTTLEQQQRINAGQGSTGIIPAAAATINQNFSVTGASAPHNTISSSLTSTTNTPVNSDSRISNTMASMLAVNSTNTQAGGRKTVSGSMQHFLGKKDANSSISYSSISNGNATSCSEQPTKVKFPRVLYNESDDGILGEYQTLLRQQLELFEADGQDVINGTFRQGRTTPIKLGQIGLRCRHCATAPMSIRTKGSVYFSQTIKGMYQIAQNMSKVHLCERCVRLPNEIKNRLVTLRSRRNRASGGRAYWIRHLRELGIYEDGNVLRARPPQIMKKRPPSTISNTNSTPGAPPTNGTV